MYASARTIKIGGKSVGAGHPCYVIAEAGSNHNGDLETAFRLIDIAADCGADAVKFQAVSFDTLTSDGENAGLKSAVDQITLDREWHRRLKDRCVAAGIEFLTTPTYEEAVDDLVETGVAALKIASMDLTNVPFIRYAASKGIPLIISRGMSTMGEIDTAIRSARGAGNEDIALLHCIANYPTNPRDVNLNSMTTLAAAYDIPVGYSDHTEGESIAAAAVALGARVVEKHFTYDRTIKGFDHFYAIEPDGLKRMISGIRDVESALGSSVVDVYDTELDAKKVAQRSIVAKRDIRSGEVLSSENMTTKRPATGLAPALWDYVVGRHAKRDLRTNHIFDVGDFD
jgi:N,N'-diacetyllegionaminate synthase